MTDNLSDRGFSPERRADALVEALPYIQRFRDAVVVVKFGGNAMVDPALSQKSGSTGVHVDPGGGPRGAWTRCGPGCGPGVDPPPGPRGPGFWTCMTRQCIRSDDSDDTTQP